MAELIECSGAPRDQGLDQGLVYRGAIRDRAARAGVDTARRSFLSLSAFTSGKTLGAGPGREIIRHYTHLAERMEGLSLGAGLRLDAVMELLLQEPGTLASPAIAAAQPAAAGDLLARALPKGESPGSRWILRRSRPEVGFDSVEVTLPWLATSVAGCNSQGVAAAVAPGEGSVGIATLLVQETLQRFHSLESALDWCVKRPGSGHGVVLLADDRGDAAAVELAGSARRVLRGEDEPLVVGADSETQSALRKALQEPGADLPSLVVESDVVAAEGTGLVSIDPVARRLRWLPGPGQPLVTASVAASPS